MNTPAMDRARAAMRAAMGRRRSDRNRRAWVTFASAVVVIGSALYRVDADDRIQLQPTHNVVAAPHSFDCGYRSSQHWLSAIERAIARGELPDRRQQALQPMAPRRVVAGGTECIPEPDASDIFLYEDTAGLLTTDFSDGQLFGLMADAANALVAARGDKFDFVGFWISFTSHHQLGTAFYLPIQNDVNGIGLGRFNNRSAFGLTGREIQGFVMMWNVNGSVWAPSTVGDSASFTRLVLGQEFEHRFGVFLPDLLDGRPLQGDDASCGRSAHWNWKIDGQGSGMEMREWLGSAPAVLGGSCVSFASDECFNTDIDPDNAVFSYTDLYLMGYVSPEEMDAGNSELRFMDDSRNCFATYGGAISTFSSADVIAVAGPRDPPAATAQKDFRTGWVMIHLPESPPTSAQLFKAVGIMAQHSLDWNYGTLGRGTMNNTLRDTCACPPADAPSPEPDASPKNRFLSIVPGNPGRSTALRVTLESVDLFHEFDSEVWWAGETTECEECDGSALVASKLDCEPVCADWGAYERLHLYDAAVVPGSRYSVQAVDCECGFDSESDYSDPLIIQTGKWCDIAPTFFTPGGSAQPDFGDLSALVDCFSCAVVNPGPTACRVQPRVPFACDDGGVFTVSFTDIGTCIDAFTGADYPLGPPDPCP